MKVERLKKSMARTSSVDIDSNVEEASNWNVRRLASPVKDWGSSDFT